MFSAILWKLRGLIWDVLAGFSVYIGLNMSRSNLKMGLRPKSKLCLFPWMDA